MDHLFDEQTLKKNEIDSNKALAYGSIFTAGVLVVLFILYLTGVFSVSHKSFVNICVAFPIFIVILGSTFFYTKTKFIEKPGFKYFLIVQFLMTMFVLNILLPKHAILGWALALVLFTHYYNPKVSIFTYISLAVLMFVALYLSMLYGEWDANLMGGSGQFGADIICAASRLTG